MPHTSLEGRRTDLPTSPSAMHPTAAAAFEALERAGVRWCLLRGEGRLQAPPHDVDLLVAPTDVVRMSSAVRPLGFVPVPTWARGSHRFYVSYLPSFDDWFVLDVVTELAYGPGYAMRTGAAEGCLARRETVDSLALLSADDAFWTLLLHCMLDRGDFPAHQIERLRRLRPAARADSPVARFATDACPPAWSARRILAAVEDDDFDALSRLAPRMVARWRRRHPLRFWVRRSADWLAWRLAPIHMLLALRGLRAAVVSDDPHVARSVAAGLRDNFYFPVVLDDRPRAAGRSRPPGRVSGAHPIIRSLAGMARWVVVRYHQSRGRLVVVPLAARCEGAAIDARRAAAAAARGLRPHLVVDLRCARPDGARPAEALAGMRPRRGGGRDAGTAPHGPIAPDSADPTSVRRQVIDKIWRAYAEHRGWSAAWPPG